MANNANYVLCSRCFRNAGVCFEAEKLGSLSSEKCPQCGAVDGAKLTTENLNTLQQAFFITGSRVSAYYPSPIGFGGAKLSAVQFEANTWTDHLLLKNFTDSDLYWYGPPLWRLGHSLLREKIESRLKPDDHPWPLGVGQDTPIETLWDEAISIVKPIVIDKGQKVFRARKLVNEPLDPFQYDSPPLEFIAPSRFNDSTHQVFYAAFDVDTCLFELKLGPSEIVKNELTVARFELNQPLRVLNLCNVDRGGLAQVDFLERMALLDGLLFPHERSYFLTQSLSRHIERRGFAGILHPSAFRYISNREAKNLTIFGAPLKDGKLELKDINSVVIESVNYDLRFGPAYKQ